MSRVIEQMNYEILFHDISFAEGAKYIKENAEEVYYVEPGYKIFNRRLLGIPPIPVGVSRDYIILVYITPPYYRGYLLKLPRDEEEVNKLKTAQIKLKRTKIGNEEVS